MRIEHCGINNPEIIKDIKRLKVIPVPQPIFLYGEGESYRAGLSQEKQEWAYPFRTWLDNGILVSFSSDCPATSGDELISPLLGMFVAVNRMTDAGNTVGPTQKIDVETALKAYTLDSAYATFEENIKGSLEEGKLADFVVLSEDPTNVNSQKIKDIHVEMTFIGGELVFEKKPLPLKND
jgi:predicted amidohydrolase YtcJ